MPLAPGADELDVWERASPISSDEKGGQSRSRRGGGSSGCEGGGSDVRVGKKRLARMGAASSGD